MPSILACSTSYCKEFHYSILLTAMLDSDQFRVSMPFFLVLGFIGPSPSLILFSLIILGGLSIVIGLTELDFRKQMWT